MADPKKWRIYDSFKLKLGQGVILLNSHTFKCALFTSTSNCDDLVHDELGDLTNQVANGFGYTTGGYTLTCTWSASGGTLTFDSDDPNWLISGGDVVCKYAVIYDDTVAGDPLVMVSRLDPSNVTTPSGNELRITISASGLFTLTGGDDI